MLSFYGGYLGHSTRSLIDSTTLSCLLKLGCAEPNDLLSWSPIKKRILELAYVSVLTPWNDGAATSIGNTLKRIASGLSQDADKNVALAAREAMRVCDQFGVPRAPPLLRIVRSAHEDSRQGSQAPESAHNIMKEIRTAVVESRKARKSMEEIEQLKTKQKRQLEEERDDAKKRRKQRASDETSMGNKSPSSSNELSKPSVEVEDLSNITAVPEKKAMKELETSEVATKEYAEENMIEDRKSEHISIQEQSKEDEEKLVEVDECDDDEFPDIVDDGPDSDDE